MSNILKRNLLRICTRPTVSISSKRCFSVSQRYLNEKEEEEKPQFSKQRVEDILAEFEKPLVDSEPDQLDPRTVLLDSVEKFKPRREVISVKNMERLHTQLSNAYTVDQLRTIVVAHKLVKRGLKKAQLVNSIIEKHWGIKTVEQIKQEERERQLDVVKQNFPASRQQLFFIIGDNGSTIREIEQENQVKVTIDVNSNEYIVEGSSASVAKAKSEILTHLNIKEDTMDVPADIAENQELKTEIANTLVDISKVAGSFITLENDKFCFASISDDSMENAKRLLKLTLKELTRKSETNHTITHTNVEYTVLPFHDPSSMSFYDRKLNWNRLETNKYDSKFKLADSEQEIETLQDVKDLLLEPFEQELDNISMEARFGHLLFQNVNNGSTTQILDLYKNRTLFFNTMPPRQLTLPFIPLTLVNGALQRSVQLSYINQDSLSKNAADKDIGLKKLNVEFDINEDGEMVLKHIAGVKKQSIIDILGMHGNIDIRLLANQYQDYLNHQELTEQCILTGELSAPRSHLIDNNKMILSDVTFVNKKLYLVDKNLVTVNRIDQQDKKASRTELVVHSVDPETMDLSNTVDKWPSFSNLLSKLANNWRY
ncbi:mitochondrial inner-membrane-bound regulator-domain-containing protein [Helicostylum pulchrum]|nr:mitochondrial inner-membrane-bound regulator-domain-containing protein [Helicostylum pulchrum]